MNITDDVFGVCLVSTQMKYISVVFRRKKLLGLDGLFVYKYLT